MSSRSARIPAERRLPRIAVAALAAAVLAAGAGGAGAQTLGQPDLPPPPAPTPTVAIPEPAPDPAPVPADPVPAPPSPTPAPTPSAPAPAPAPAPVSPAPSTDDGAAQAAAAAAARARQRAAQARRLRQARAQKAAVTRISGDVGTGVTDASTALTRLGGATENPAVQRPAAAVSGTAVAPDSGRESTLAFLLLGLSGATAAVALLPLRSMRAGGGRSSLSFVERHRLELAGISTSCLLVALLVFVGLI